MKKNKLLQICQLFSSIDFFWKKECTGGYTTDEKRIFSISESRAKLAWAMPNVEKGDEIEI